MLWNTVRDRRMVTPANIDVGSDTICLQIWKNVATCTDINKRKIRKLSSNEGMIEIYIYMCKYT